MLPKKLTQSKQQLLLRYAVTFQEVQKLRSLMKNQIKLVAHWYFQKLVSITKTDRARRSGLQNVSG